MVEVLREALHDMRYNELNMASAWVRRSGLSQIKDSLQDFTNSGGRSLLVTGVSMSGATRQGLALAKDLFDEAFVFHQVGRTFHPKLTLLRGDDAALALIGSSNLTAGGLASNWEVNVAIELDPHEPDDAVQLHALRNYFAELRTDRAACRPLNHAVIQRLIDDPALQIGDEDAMAPADSPSTAAGPSERLFGPTESTLRQHLHAPTLTFLKPPMGATPASSAAGDLGSPRRTKPRVLYRWTKSYPWRMPKGFAAAPPATQSP